MGQEMSQEQIDPSIPPQTLDARTVQGVADFINDGQPKRIVVMTGAGISTSAGIPDFRSPGTGLYANLARLNLPYPEAVFDINFFRQKPEPFYVLAKELYPGKYFPTVSHAFVELLNQKDLLTMAFTQNIDCLERKAGVPDDKIVEAHGSFATQRCIECKTEYPDDLMKEVVEAGKVPHCITPQCNGLVKPDIVFFGEGLPSNFFDNRYQVAMADIIIVMGTSLMVQPFASLPVLAEAGVPRVLINNEVVGGFGSRPDDVMILGDCDAGVRKLADALGWRDELEALWATINGGKAVEKEPEAITTDEALEAEIEKLTGEVDAALKISQDHTEDVKTQLKKETSSESKEVSSPESTESATSKTPLSSGASNLQSTLPTKSELGWKEPPTTPYNTENIPPKTETLDEVPFHLDPTFPQNRPDHE